MASQGPNSPGTLGEDTSYGDNSWIGASNVASSNDVYAESSVNTFPSTTNTYYFKATNFGFSIPGSATIDGILVEIEKKESDAVDDVIDRRVRIVKGGVIGTTDKADATEWPTADAYTSYGGAADLWGETWTATQINASDFGVVIAAGTTAAIGIPLIDHIRITVTYTENPFDPTAQAPAFYRAQQSVQSIPLAGRLQNILPIVTADYVPVPLPASFLRQHPRTQLPPSPTPRSGVAVGVLEPTLFVDEQPQDWFRGVDAKCAPQPPKRTQTGKTAYNPVPFPEQLPELGWNQPVRAQAPTILPPRNRSTVLWIPEPPAHGHEAWAFIKTTSGRFPERHTNRSWYSSGYEPDAPGRDAWMIYRKPAPIFPRANQSTISFVGPMTGPFVVPHFVRGQSAPIDARWPSRSLVAMPSFEELHSYPSRWGFIRAQANIQPPPLSRSWYSYLEPTREPLPSVIVARPTIMPVRGSSNVFHAGDPGEADLPMPMYMLSTGGRLPSPFKPTQAVFSVLESISTGVMPIGWLRPMICRVPTLLIRGACSTIYETLMGNISTATRRDDRDTTGVSGRNASSSGGSGRNRTSRGTGTNV